MTSYRVSFYYLQINSIFSQSIDEKLLHVLIRVQHLIGLVQMRLDIVIIIIKY